MTDIAVPDSRGELAAAEPSAPELSALALWAKDAAQAHQIAASLAQTSFVPTSMRGKPHDVTAAILAGQELGLMPMASLRSMDIIQGIPALRANAMRGLVQSHGHAIQVVSSSPTRCVVRGRRRGETDWQQVEWTIERAKQMLLAEKSEWKKQPQTMLVARATSELCRLIAADALFAMPYAAEELIGAAVGDAEVPVAVPRVTAAEILQPRDVPAVTAGPDPWATPEPEESAAWPAAAEPGSGVPS